MIPTTLLLAVGVPGEDTGANLDAGMVCVLPAGVTPTGTKVVVERRTGSLPGTGVARELLGIALGANLTYLYVPSAYQGQRQVYAIRWSDLAAGHSTVSVTTPAPSGSVAFGAQIG